MQIQSYNQELLLANLLFKRLFNNISIVSEGREIKFQCLLGNRSRILKSMENPERNSMQRLPLIIVERTGITRNNERLSNLNNEIKYRKHSSTLTYDLFTPVPIDIQYSVTIVSKYQDHIDKCVSNFIPFFNKDLFVRCEHPKFEGVEFTNQVVMDDSIDMERPEEIDPSQDDIITCTCNFTFKTFMFCGTIKSKDSGIQYIVKTQLSSTYDEETSSYVSSVVSVITESEYIGFVPQINTINVGFYPIPLLSTYQGQFNFVDSLCAETYEKTLELKDPHLDCFKWKIDENGDLSLISGRYY